MRAFLRAAAVAVALTFTVAACEGCDPYECGPGDRDGDGDGRCHE